MHMPAVFHPPIQKLSACVFGKSKKKKSWEEGTRRKIKPKKLKIATNGLEKKKQKKTSMNPPR